MEIYFTFDNTHTVILAEKVLLTASIAVKVRPIPNSIKAGCGLSLCLDLSQKQAAKAEMQKASIRYSAIYLYNKGEFTLTD